MATEQVETDVGVTVCTSIQEPYLLMAVVGNSHTYTGGPTRSATYANAQDMTGV